MIIIPKRLNLAKKLSAIKYLWIASFNKKYIKTELNKLFNKISIVFFLISMTPLFLKIKYNIITFNQADIDVAKANPTCLYSSIRSKLKNKFANKAIKPTLTGVLVSSLEKKNYWKYFD